MKKQLYSAALILPILLSGCNNDKPNTENQKTEQEQSKKLNDNQFNEVLTKYKEIDALTLDILKKAPNNINTYNTTDLRKLNVDTDIKNYEIPASHPLKIEMQDASIKDKPTFAAIYMNEKLYKQLKKNTNVKLFVKLDRNKLGQPITIAERIATTADQKLVKKQQDAIKPLKTKRKAIENELLKYRKSDLAALQQDYLKGGTKNASAKLSESMQKLASKMMYYRDNSPFKIVSVSSANKDKDYKLVKIDRTDIKDEKRFYTSYLVKNKLASKLKKNDVHNYVINYNTVQLKKYPEIVYIADGDNKKWKSYAKDIRETKLELNKKRKALVKETEPLLAIERLARGPLTDQDYIGYLK